MVNPPPWGSVPQPGEELTAVDALTLHVPVVLAEVIEARVHLCRLQGDVPGDGVVGRVRAVPQDVLEGRARGVGVQAVAEGGGHRVQV
jgi:hypothetical protein